MNRLKNVTTLIGLVLLAASSLSTVRLRSTFAVEAMHDTQKEDAPGVSWHHPLYLHWGGYWKSRVRVTYHNRGARDLAGYPVALPVVSPGSFSAGAASGIPLAGRNIRDIRVCTADGTELLWAACDEDMVSFTEGTFPPKGWLVVPVTCPARGKTEFFVYFDNPEAIEVPDYFSAKPCPINCGVEKGEGETPSGWQHDASGPDRRAYWSNENPHSGAKCLAIEVQPGSKPSWIATRQTGVAVVPGVRYRFRAWVRAENVEGYAGWYIHVGNAENPMMIAPTISGGGGTYDWKQVEAEFTAPEGATTASLGTVLWGTGRAWFDDVEWEMDPQACEVVIHSPESSALAEVDETQAWPSSQENHFLGNQRLHLELLNFDTQARQNVLACLGPNVWGGRLPLLAETDRVRMFAGTTRIKPFVVGEYLLWPDHLPARSRVHRYVYCEDPTSVQPISVQPIEEKDATNKVLLEYMALLNSSNNLVQNFSFEAGGDIPEGWVQSGAGDGRVKFSVEDPKHEGFGRRAARLDIPSGTPSAWRGWQQRIPVKAGTTYLVAGWLKCQDLEGEARIHIHFHDSQGRLCKSGGMTSVGPGVRATQPWTLVSGLVKTPNDAASLTLHLTTNVSGTLWHDAIFVAEVCNVSCVKREAAPMAKDAFVVWQVPAVVKVFREDPPVRERQSIQVSAAKGEWEALQLAVRSGTSLAEVRVEVLPPRNRNNKQLDRFEVTVVGYVPIDYPTNYYRFDGPEWHRKIPQQSPGSDGWPGWWPDPLLPKSQFSLAAETTQAVWIVFKIPQDAESGDYDGTVRFIGQGRVLAEVPFSVHIWNFALPRETTFPAIYDVRLGPAGRVFGQTLDQLYPEIVRFMAERRLCPDNIRPDPVIEYRDGQVRADFTEYDRVARWYFDTLKLPVTYTPHVFYLFGWGFPPRNFFGQTPYPGDSPFEGVNRSELRPEYVAAYQACLKCYWDHMKENGWSDRVVLYISDEPFDHLPEIREQMIALCKMIHDAVPEIPIYSSTWHHIPDWDGSITVWGLGHDGRVPPEKLRALREGSAQVWFTTDGQMCTDTPYCAVERLLPHYCFHHGVRAYEFWGVAWTTYDPYRFGWHSFIPQSDRPGTRYWVRYPNGDGFLIYPGKPIGYDGLVSSIRLEQAREGVEDYEYLSILKTVATKARPDDPRRKAAESILAKASQLATIPNAGGRYSTKILPNPGMLEEIRKELAEAIEQFVSNQ